MDAMTKAKEMDQKFFVIVDGDEGICLVGVDPPVVRYLTIGDLHFVEQHLDLPPAHRSLENVALRLAGKWSTSEEDGKVTACMNEIRGMNTDGSLGSDDVRLINACLTGYPPMSLLVGRGKR
jgi:hypothetical protein